MSEITISSTTNSQSEVDATADYDQQVGHGESPPTERPHTVVTSPTDSELQVDEATKYRGEQDAYDGAWLQQAPDKPLPVQSTTDPPEVVREESAKLREHQETTGTDYATGLPKRGAEKRIAQLTREKMEARAEAEALRAQLHSQYQQQPPPQQPQYQPQAQQQYSPTQQQSILEEYRAAQARIVEEEKQAVQKYPDYTESIKRLEPGNATPIPPTSYYHLMLNVKNAPDVGYYLSRHPETIAKLWSLESSGRGVDAMTELNHISSGLSFQGNISQSGAGSSARRERQPNSGPPAPIRPVGGSQMSSSTGGYSESMTQRQYNEWRDGGGGGGRGRR